MKDKEYKLDIFDTLQQINDKNIQFYNTLPVEKQKGFLPAVVFRWLYGSPHDLQIILLNQFVNPLLYALSSKHPDLIYKLFTITSVQSQTSYRWKSKIKEVNLPLSLNIVATYFAISKREAKMHLSAFKAADIIEMGEYIGLQKEEMKKLKLELKKL